MTDVITHYLDVWTSAIASKSNAGRGTSDKHTAYGIKKLRELIFEIASAGLLIHKEIDTAEKKVKLGEVVTLVMGQAPPGNECNKEGIGTIFVKTGEFGPIYPEVKEWTTKPLKYAQLGDVLICVVGATVGKLNLAIDCAIGRSVAAIRPNEELDTNYLFFALMPYTLKLRNQSRGSAQGVIGKEELNSVEIRLPCLAEQHRIVAKVDELMALCDQLEQQQTNSIAAHQTLVQTLLDTLTQAADTAQFEQAWSRIADHFDTLFTTESSINQLKQTLLQLAVMGKLVPQNPNDEPATELLMRIQVEKANLIEEGKIKKDKLLAAIREEEKPFELPKGWEWVRLGVVFDIAGGVTLGRKLTGPDLAELPYLRVANVQRGHLVLDSIKTVEIRQSELARYQLLKNDLLVTEGGDWDKVGRTAIWNSEIDNCLHQNHIFRMRGLTEDLSSSWVEMYMNSIAKAYFQAASKQTTNLASINMTQLKNCLLVVPALQEQHRIVAKVDELMALCDALKARIASAQTTQLQLADAIVEQAVA
ncbi:MULTISPECIES: restriction endonuclease subunit S [Methylomonas]|uniref:Type I restriction modification DNA specificity domain-containing protein n=2 Tax=Methylomonas TaxID=416 RepID=A0A140E6P1_9GAMM|nr:MULTISPECIES: restriction endonuclease subunit S [Methylomonas]AMK79065.1 hypothetical protein JT25_021700 [Methylomonas denitrificans]OAI09290.1 hypothetical protein A1342_02860 [Methylomonas methanica]TCV79141.1 type I restriction enzyme S subunit [Methylomonas methanica]